MIKGIVADSTQLNDIAKLLPNDFSTIVELIGTDEEDKILDLWRDEIESRLEKLNTMKYFCGQDDGKDFIFSDCDEGILAIAQLCKKCDCRFTIL